MGMGPRIREDTGGGRGRVVREPPIRVGREVEDTWLRLGREPQGARLRLASIPIGEVPVADVG